ncbi:IclR family transcriptional regulator [Corynebacterium sp. UMB10119B.1]|uniref:IclR family transcriptional regulator n=1 Tax=Corynebacterium sp. UMB10119B.1 TaxID=3050601 RepID=UPI0025509D66|nr:IclR family transcriptional regulator [Corynebacterium sp. UMB10119B]MDK8363814.1 IclR family transcriptional regulator [Corynebacterium sp. UMB10119B]
MVQDAKPNSIDKAFGILKAFKSEDVNGVGVSELARRVDLPKSTTHRLLNKLVENDAVLKANELYRLNPALGMTSTPEVYSEQTAQVSELLTPFLAALFERTRHTVHLGHVEGTNVRYANKLFSVRGVTAPSRIGGLIPAYATGIGKAIMAYDETLTERIIREGLAPWTPHTISDPDELRETLKKIHDEGIAYDLEEISEGLCCVACPIFGTEGVPIAAMSVSFPAEDFQPKTVIPVLKKICGSGTRAWRAKHAG